MITYSEEFSGARFAASGERVKIYGQFKCSGGVLVEITFNGTIDDAPFNGSFDDKGNLSLLRIDPDAALVAIPEIKSLYANVMAKISA